MRPRSSERTDSAVPIPFGCGKRDRVDADPLALGHPLQVDAEVDVDEDEAAPVEHGADPVADVGGDQRPLQRRRLLAGDQRHPIRIQTVAGPGSRNPPLTDRHSIAVW